MERAGGEAESRANGRWIKCRQARGREKQRKWRGRGRAVSELDRVPAATAGCGEGAGTRSLACLASLAGAWLTEPVDPDVDQKQDQESLRRSKRQSTNPRGRRMPSGTISEAPSDLTSISNPSDRAPSPSPKPEQSDGLPAVACVRSAAASAAMPAGMPSLPRRSVLGAVSIREKYRATCTPFLSSSLEPVVRRRRSERNDGLAMRLLTIDARGNPSRERRNHATTPRPRTSLRRGVCTAVDSAGRQVRASPRAFVTKTAAIYERTSLTESRQPTDPSADCPGR